jgi:hypothetical protein
VISFILGAVMTFLWDVIFKSILPPGHPALPPPEPAVSIGNVKLTGADIRAGYELFADLARGTVNVQDEEAVADIIIDTALTAAGPAAVIAAPVLKILERRILEGIANGTIHGSLDPIHEAQTKEGRGGRRP